MRKLFILLVFLNGCLTTSMQYDLPRVRDTLYQKEIFGKRVNGYFTAEHINIEYSRDKNGRIYGGVADGLIKCQFEDGFSQIEPSTEIWYPNSLSPEEERYRERVDHIIKEHPQLIHKLLK